MATGFEALGAASAVIQLISFAGSLISLTLKIYDGKLTPQIELEEHAEKMLSAAQRVQSRNARVPQGIPVGNKLSEVAQQCIDAAEELRQETQTITKRYQKGKVFKAVYAAIRADKHKTKIMALDKSLRMCKERMETELLIKICDQSTAIEQQQSQGFQALENDLQRLISQIANGNLRIDNLVTREAKATRDEINTHVTSELRAMGARNISDSQRQRLLKSLKAEEIRQRYNDVLASSDACFERVFASYERVCCKDPEHKSWKKIKNSFHISINGDKSSKRFERVAKWLKVSQEDVDDIDQLWYRFSSWLQSKDKLFWIKGKPGSGKSTLIKFILNNDNTERLLHSWSPEPKIISHFFWKIGSEPQNSIKGLLCSLLYDILSDDDVATQKILETFASSLSKDFYKEWSREEAEEVLLFLLRTGARSVCIFIDGLDEISNKDGFTALMSVVQMLTSLSRVKVCVSSRPETELANRLESLGAQGLQLDDLTRPEMAVYIHQELQVSEGRVSASFINHSTFKLLEKAQGVFLWLVLSTQSLVNGINNGDDEQMLCRRLEELPEELEALYESMWSRLNGGNQVYRETASRYFRCILANERNGGVTIRWEGMSRVLCELTLPHLSLMVKGEDHLIFPPKAHKQTLVELNDMCDLTAEDIRTRCAGLLQVKENPLWKTYDFLPENCPFKRQVSFIHRTAHDFLQDTESGQSILNYKSNATTSASIEVKLVKSWLYLANAYQTIGVSAAVYDTLSQCDQLNDVGVDEDKILEILLVIESLYEKGILKHDFGEVYPVRPLRPRMAYFLAGFERFFMASFVRPASPGFTTMRLRDIAVENILCVKGYASGLPAKLIQNIIAQGGDPHAIGRSSLSLKASDEGSFITQQTTTFELLLRGAMNQLFKKDRQGLPEFLDVIDIMARTCPNWQRKVMLYARWSDISCYSWILEGWELFVPYFDTYPVWVAFEVDLQFLLTQILAGADLWNIPTYSYKLHEISASFNKPHVHIRHIGPEQPYHKELFCYRVQAQEPFQNLIDHFFAPKEWSSDDLSDDRHLLRCFNIRSMTSSDPTFEYYVRSCELVSLGNEIDSLVQEDLELYWTEELDLSSPS